MSVDNKQDIKALFKNAALLLQERRKAKPENSQPTGRVLFLYEHTASGVKCCQPEYFTDLEEARRFYALYTHSHIEPIRLYEAPETGYRQGGHYWPYVEPPIEY